MILKDPRVDVKGEGVVYTVLELRRTYQGGDGR
jgi:hypothetical protein